MRKPMTASLSPKRLGLLVAVAALLSACTADSSTRPAASTSVEAALTPPGATRSVTGLTDGTYVVTFDPTLDQTFAMGKNKLVMPANSVCDMTQSSYGMGFWNDSCVTETKPVTMTVVINDSQANYPRIDFFPAMRFNPAKDVELYFFVKKATPQDATNWVMLYCPTLAASCLDESKLDSDLATQVDRKKQLVFRRIKHFSGYVIAGGRDSTDSTATGGY